MKIVLRRFLISVQIGALIAVAPAASFAEEVGTGPKIFDAAVLRPLGTVKLAVGMLFLIPASVLYTFRMPFDSDTGVFQEAAEMLVVEPANYVFRRPLGEDLSGD
jgi:uncharacterized membrane protein